MSEPTLDTLEARLQRLEHQRRRFHLLGVVALIGLGAIGVMGQTRAAPRVIEAEAFHLKDQTGRIVATLDVGDNGEPTLELGDGAALTPNRLIFIDKERYPTIAIHTGGLLVSKKGQARAALGWNRSGSLSLNVYDQSGRDAVVLSEIGLVVTKANVSASLGIHPAGAALAGCGKTA